MEEHLPEEEGAGKSGRVVAAVSSVSTTRMTSHRWQLCNGEGRCVAAHGSGPEVSLSKTLEPDLMMI